jgi:thymidylate synthase (FAD)
MGTAIVQTARVSYGKGTKSVSDDRGLIRYLMRHAHTTPFEMVEFNFRIRVPMDCWRQQMGHRATSVKEYSTRYSEAIDSMQTTAKVRRGPRAGPQGLAAAKLTEAWWPCDLDNLFHFLRLRRDLHAQLEIRTVAKAMGELIKPIVPLALRGPPPGRLAAWRLRSILGRLQVARRHGRLAWRQFFLRRNNPSHKDTFPC